MLIDKATRVAYTDRMLNAMLERPLADFSMPDLKLFSTGQVAEAVGLPFGTLKRWFDRNLMADVLPSETMADLGRGRHRLLTLREAVRVGFMARLAALEVGPTTAARLATTLRAFDDDDPDWMQSERPIFALASPAESGVALRIAKPPAKGHRLAEEQFTPGPVLIVELTDLARDVAARLEKAPRRRAARWAADEGGSG